MKPAFTLLELLLVITIIGVLVSVLVVDFVGVKQRQELSLMADQSVAMLQQARGDVQAGKVRTVWDEAGEVEEKIYLCEGAFFETDSGAPTWVVTDYDRDSGSCDVENPRPEHYGISTGEAFVDAIDIGGTSSFNLYVLYAPPSGELIFYEPNAGFLSGDASIHFSHTTEPDMDISLEISALTGLISLSTGDEK